MSTGTTNMAIAPASADVPLRRIKTSTNTVTTPAHGSDTPSSPFLPLAMTLPAITSAEKRELSICDAHVRKAMAAIRASRIEIAYFGWRIKRSQRWMEFGCATEDEYRTSREIPSRTWQECMVVGQLLEALSFDDLSAIGVENGIRLSFVNPDIWYDYDWLQDARSTPYREFRKLVALRNQTLDGGEHSVAIERSRQRQVTRDRLREICREHKLATIDDALSLALDGVGVSVSAQLLAASKHANKLLSIAIKGMHKGKRGYQFRQSHLGGETDRIVGLAKKRLADAIAIAVESARSAGAAGASGASMTVATNDRLHAENRAFPSTSAGSHAGAVDRGAAQAQTQAQA